MESRLDAASIFGKAIDEHMEVVRQVREQQAVLQSIARAISAALHAGGKVLWCGNGGSAADSQHMDAELVGRFRRERRALASVALTTNTSVLTAIGNDYGYDAVFARQVEAIGSSGDVLVGLSTSGNSQNVVMAMELGRKLGLATVAFTGAGGGRMAALADHLFAVSSDNTARIQEAHILAGHMLCDWIEIDCMDAGSFVRTKEAEVR
jgi:D-sedoheptulose 7-phosphate isomerase